MPWQYLNFPVYEPGCIPDTYYTCGPTCDPYWSYVALNMQFEGVQGGTTFVDTSPRPKAITSSLATTDTLTKKIGTSAGKFIASSYVKAASSTEFGFSTLPFTIECWAYLNAYNATYDKALLDTRSIGTDQAYALMIDHTDNTIGAYYSGFYYAKSLSPFPLNKWTHVALTFDGGTHKLFVDGVLQGTANMGSVDLPGPRACVIGSTYNLSGVNAWNGYIDEVRITKGICRYWGDYSLQTVSYPTCEEAASTTTSINFSATATGVTQTTPTPLTFGVQTTTAASVVYVRGITDVRGPGKRYVEFVIQGSGDSATNTGVGHAIGFASLNDAYIDSPQFTSGFVMHNVSDPALSIPAPGYSMNGSSTWVSNSNYNFVQGDVIGMAFDHTSGKLWVRKNGGAWIGGGDPVAGTTPSVTLTGGLSGATPAWTLVPVCYAINHPGRTGSWQTRILIEGDVFFATAPTGYVPYRGPWYDTSVRTVLLLHSEPSDALPTTSMLSAARYGTTTVSVVVPWNNGVMGKPVAGHTTALIGQWDNNYFQPCRVYAYDVDVTTGIMTYVGNYSIPQADLFYPTSSAKGSSDVSIWVGGDGFNVFTYEGTTGVRHQYQGELTTNSFSGQQIRFARSGTTIVFGSTSYNRLKAYNINSYTPYATSPALNPVSTDGFASVLIIGTKVYASVYATNAAYEVKVYELDLATLALLNTYVITKDIYAAASYGTLFELNGSVAYSVVGLDQQDWVSTTDFYLLVNGSFIQNGQIPVAAPSAYLTENDCVSTFQYGSTVVVGKIYDQNAIPMKYALYKIDVADLFFNTVDSSCYHPKVIQKIGLAANTHLSSSVAKFGTTSLYTPNPSATITNQLGWKVLTHQDFGFGTEDFTFDLWAYRVSNVRNGVLFYAPNASYGGYCSYVVNTAGKIVINYITGPLGGQNSISTNVIFPLNTWNNVILQRRGIYLESYLNGNLISRATLASGLNATFGVTGALYIGREEVAAATQWNGYIDEFRITRGTSRISGSALSASLITCVGVTEPTTASATVTFPAHQAGDTLVVYAQSSSATIPSLPAGWTNVGTLAPTNGSAYRVAYKLDTDNSISSVTFTNGTSLIGMVYRGVESLGAVALTPANSGSVTTITLPSLTLQVTTGSSLVVSIGTVNQSVAMSTPTGMVFRADNLSPTVGTTATVWDTGNGVGSFTGGTTSYTPAGYGSAISFELRSALVFSPAGNVNCGG